MSITLRWLGQCSLAVEAGAISPGRLKGLSRDQICRLSLPVGNTRLPLGDLFAVDGDGADGVLTIEGDLKHLHGLAHEMHEGTLILRGDVGVRLASGQSGGRVEVHGAVGSWAFAEMSGGQAHVHGSAGAHLGSALPGSRVGMRGGEILIDGSVGADCGLAMRRGLIAIGGDAGQGLGWGMVAGTIFVLGRVDRLVGLGMKRGSIVAFGEAPHILPTFAASGTSCPPFVTLYLSQLRAWGFSLPEEVFALRFDRYNGDLAGKGQGELLVRTG